MSRWTFKLYERGHFDAVDLPLTAVIAYGWWHWWQASGPTPLLLFCFCAFAISYAGAYRRLRKLGLCKWPWEPR